MADWGGLGVSGALSCYVNFLPSANKPSPAQRLSATQMGALSTKYNTKFQLGLGDNFYCKLIKFRFSKKFTYNILLSMWSIK